MRRYLYLLGGGLTLAGCSLINTTAQFRADDASMTPDAGTCGGGDASCACTVGTTRPCPTGTSTGECEVGSQSCTGAGVWGACVGAIGPASELCDGLDNDCDGTTDDNAATTSCGAVTRGTAACSLGACTVAGCTVGFGDCNTMFADGCESPLGTVAHCMSCRDVCAWACASAGCDDVVQIAMGGAHACARRASGDVYCWGQNTRGQLGDGTMTDRDHPVRVSGLTGPAIDIALGLSHSCAIIQGGTIRCWGENMDGQLGDGSNTPSVAPVGVHNFGGVAQQLAAGGAYTCARASDGSVACWGKNTSGQLGNGSTSSINAAQGVTGLGIATDLSAYNTHTCAVVSGHAYCWGFNASGQLGDGSTMMRTMPVLVQGLSGVAEVAVGYIHTCARLDTGSVACWGNNDSGQLGDGTMTGRPTPALIASLTNAVEIVEGQFYGCARRADGSVSCWGGNGSGQLGDGTTTARPSPVAVVGLGAMATQLTANATSTCAVVGTGLPRCWGYNSNAQLGDGSFLQRTMPVTVLPP